MDLKNLKAFVKLYERKSLRQAAAELYISPQGLSRILQNLESELDVILFRRTPQGLLPTEAGEYLYSQAGKLLEQNERLYQNLQSLSGRERDLSFVCSYGAMNALPYPRFLRFQQKYPALSAKWREFPDAQARRLLQEGEYELGLLVGEAADMPEKCKAVPLFVRRMVLLVYQGHPLWEREQVSFEELAGESIVMEGQDFWIFEAFRRRCIAHGFCPNITVETGDISFCHKLCEMGQGLGVTVDFIADFIRTPGVRATPFADEGFLWPVQLVHPRERLLSPGVKAFRNYLLEELGGEPETKAEHLSANR